MTWERMTRHKHSGGLGFRNFREFNLAMLGKQCWRLITDPDSLTARLYKARYFKNTSFLDAKLGNSPRFIWRSLMEAKNVILGGSRWRIGPGDDIVIVDRLWLASKENSFIMTRSTSIENQSVRALMHTDRRAWDWEIIIDIFHEQDQDYIRATHIEVDLDRNVLQWEREISGQYIVKSAYKLLQIQKGAYESQNSNNTWKSLWQNKAPSKALNVMWRALSKCLPTKSRLQQKKV